ncbi:MAG: MFS transporter [Acidobacteriota bacterium]|nr:MFS transporter [Acidobacteriota bacterium]
MAISGVFGNRTFRYLFGAATASNFGSMLNAMALPFVAIIVLDASPADIASLTAAGILPGFVLGLLASTWVDRLPRRLVMMVADWGRAVLLLWIPIGAALDVLTLLQLHLVVAGHGLLGFLFGTASHAVLPQVVEGSQLVEANGRIKAADAVTEGVAFASGGWLVQWLTAPLVILVDAVSYAVSGLLLVGVKTKGAHNPTGPQDRRSIWSEMGTGLAFLVSHPLLLPSAASVALSLMGWRMAGVAYMLFVYEELGLQPGVLGLAFSAGAVSCFLGALGAERLGPRIGVGPAMILGLGVFAAAAFVLPLVPVASTPALWALALAVLVVHQLADGFEVIFEIHQTSLQQTVTPDALLGRVGGAVRFACSGAALGGLLLGGLIGERYGLRATLGAGAVVLALGWLILVLSPVRVLRELPRSET